MNFFINEDLDNFISINNISYSEFSECISTIDNDRTYYVIAASPYEKSSFDVVINYCRKSRNGNFQLCYVKSDNVQMMSKYGADCGFIVILDSKIDIEDLKRRFAMKAFW